MQPSERTRWLELLSYIQALVYHARGKAERGGLQQVIEASVRTEEHHRQEVKTMGRTIAEGLKAAGLKKGRREGELRLGRRTLLVLLHQRFGELPAPLVAAVEPTTNIEQPEAWLGRVLEAESLEDLGIA